MITRLTALVLALVMGVPLCWCCMAAAPAAAAGVAEESCSACKYLDLEEEQPAPAPLTSHQDRSCCAKFNQRNLSPDVAAAPRLVLVDLQAWVWMRPEFLPPSDWTEGNIPKDFATPSPAWHGPPLYRQQCALLL